jgi:hypothetical protein
MSRVPLWLGVAAVPTFSVVPQLQAQSGIIHEQVEVAATNDEWTPTSVTVARGDIILVLARGRIRVGQFVGEAGPAGIVSSGDGALHLKIGVGAGQRVGERAFLVADQPGQVKLRIHDSRRDDNSGSFQVNVIFIPAAAIPEPIGAATTTPGGESPYLASVRSDLRDLVTAQEAYFADSVRYSSDMRALRYSNTTGVTITEIRLTKDGWVAYANHAMMPAWMCAIYVGSGPAPTPGQREGEPRCWR